MAKTLRELYPSVRTREQIVKDIMDTPNLKLTFESWDNDTQEHFLDFCSGAKGVKMLYDGFFKEILDPDSKPQRLEDLLSLIFKQKILIKKVLPNDSSRIASESFLLILDIVIELEDGSLANVECQRIGYSFIGQRAACYSADLLLRQYKRVRNEKKKKFLYKDVKKVCSIIFYETSPTEFKAFPSDMVHHFQQTSDTGLKLDLLQEYFFIPLDIVNRIYHNDNVIDNKLTAWFIFLSNDDPEVIANLIATYPDFKQMYHEVYEMCLSTEKVMDMFSEELRMIDKNTVEYMLDQMQAEIEQNRMLLEQQNAEIEQRNAEIQQRNAEIQQRNAEIEQRNAEIAKKDALIEQLQKQLAEK